MTQQELKDRYLGYQFISYGHFKIGFVIRGKNYHCTTTNTLAIDRIDDNLQHIERNRVYVTQKQALRSLYDEVKKANNL